MGNRDGALTRAHTGWKKSNIEGKNTMFALLKIRWDTKEVSVLMVGDAATVNGEYLALIERNRKRAYSVSYDLKVRKVAS